LSSASYQTTGDILYADVLRNAYVTNRNEIACRKGSRVITYFGGVSAFYGNNPNFHQFVFDGITYLVTKVGQDVFLDSCDSTFVIRKNISKLSAFPFVNSDTDRAAFSTIIEGNICYVFMATKKAPLVVGILIKRDINLSTATGSSLVGTITNYPATNVITNSNTFLYNTGNNNSFISTSAITQSAFNLSITTTVAHGLSISDSVRIHSFFVCNTRSANYYPGSALYGIAARKNAVPLDVNVQLPTDLVGNQISNETKQQRLDLNTTIVYQTNSATATTYTRVYTNQPSVDTEYEFSDGGFISGDASIFTTRTPTFISFGALQAGGATSQVYCFRMREVLVNPNVSTNSSNLKAYVDKTTTTPTYYDSTGAVTTTAVSNFSFATSNRPGLNLAGVVEIIYKSTGTEVDLSNNVASITIADGYTIPLYGYGAIANIQANIYPNVVVSVGNRLILSGYDNKVHFSNSNWAYRGISWNNFQVSTIDFAVTSAYTVALGQQSSKVIGLASVNGVIIVSTDVGIFRLSGSDPTLPPNATSVNFSRLSNEILSTNESLLVYENRVFFVSRNGLFQLEYSRDVQELLLTPLSTQVSDHFKLIPYAIVYSKTYRAFFIGFNDTPELLVYLFESDTWATFKFAFTGQPILNQTFDGYAVNFSRTGDAFTNLHQVVWDLTYDNDLQNIGLIAPNTIINARSTTLTSTPIDISNLCTPPELIELLDPGNNTLVQAYGNCAAKSASGGSVVISEYVGGGNAPVVSYLVTKAFYSDKMIRANRVRSVNLLCFGYGNLYSRLLFSGKSDDNIGQFIDATAVNGTGWLQEKANISYRAINGDTVNVRLRYQGVGEAWVLATKIPSGLVLLGWQLDTSVKKQRGRLQ
jgi:hypothetical protein